MLLDDSNRVLAGNFPEPSILPSLRRIGLTTRLRLKEGWYPGNPVDTVPPTVSAVHDTANASFENQVRYLTTGKTLDEAEDSRITCDVTGHRSIGTAQDCSRRCSPTHQYVYSLSFDHVSSFRTFLLFLARSRLGSRNSPASQSHCSARQVRWYVTSSIPYPYLHPCPIYPVPMPHQMSR